MACIGPMHFGCSSFQQLHDNFFLAVTGSDLESLARETEGK